MKCISSKTGASVSRNRISQNNIEITDFNSLATNNKLDKKNLLIFHTPQITNKIILFANGVSKFSRNSHREHGYTHWFSSIMLQHIF